MRQIISDIKEFLSSGWIIFIPITIICCITVCIALLATTNGVKWWPKRSSAVFRCLVWLPPLPSLTATLPSVCRPTCCKRNATTSARTLTSVPTNRAASSSIPTGQARAAIPLQPHTIFNLSRQTKGRLSISDGLFIGLSTMKNETI